MDHNFYLLMAPIVIVFLLSNIYTLPLFQIRHFLSYGNIVRENRLKVLFMTDSYEVEAWVNE